MCTFHPVGMIPYLSEMVNRLQNGLYRTSAHNRNILGGMSSIPDALFGSNELRTSYTSISVNPTEFIVLDRPGKSSMDGELDVVANKN